ncbi:hypothetical protein XELAEV_18040246mg [Xenopus laevis]|uniref:G-protein coupled receptors family 3 profile domain-containing protein n=1 Tax=Xenopus laevis TaxID=8355 RepID=A0A974C9B9_XENLA|nr:hypothetical protein XELAEV_18040246mg [Xenopus laevis]
MLQKFTRERILLHCEHYSQTVSMSNYLKNELKYSSGKNIFFSENGDPSANFDIVNWLIYPNNTVRKNHLGTFVPASPSSAQQFIINDGVLSWNPFFNQSPRSVCSEPCLPGFHKSLQNGKPPCCFDCVQCSKGEISNLSDAEHCVKCPEDHWSHPSKNLCIKRTIEFLSYTEPLGTLLTTITVTFSIITTTVLWLFVRHRNTPIVKANNCHLSYILLVSIILSLLCSFLFIGRPTSLTCLLRQIILVFMFSISLSSLLEKTVTVIMAFNATKPRNKFRKWFGSNTSIIMIFICSSGEFVICICWLVCAPPYVHYDTKSTVSTITLQCREQSIMAFSLAISYVGSLAISCFIVAFLARKLPDRFNEAKHISFSMLVFCCVWVSFIPTYLSAKGKYMVAVEIFTILASNAGLILCIFLPKCHIIILEPELNTNNHWRQRCINK